ncbi:hypothetical protein HMPREF9970_0103 [Lachnoanaerobaculum saburreum F0468]|uniref:Uncharacterized protein n=1 Tax=Lachnoanaerobaculum saburreum F0468 TaxID=1095750 RepID=I0R6U7_9FIRM|nr:hypothetical protein HMPREF9970_0103 [Lachnoanaerobaculum saburreum F0468]
MFLDGFFVESPMLIVLSSVIIVAFKAIAISHGTEIFLFD